MMSSTRPFARFGLSLLIAFLSGRAAEAQTCQIELVTAEIFPMGVQNSVHGAVLSADGRFCAFGSYGSGFVANDTNGVPDVFVRELATGAMTRVSVDENGNQVAGASWFPFLSGDGRFVVFTSAAPLTAADSGTNPDVYRYDRTTGDLLLISRTPAGTGGNSESRKASCSADGRFVIFYSSATDLVPPDTNAADDVFVRDVQTGTTTRVTVGFTGAQAFALVPGGENGIHLLDMPPRISADGRLAFFESTFSNLVPNDTNTVAGNFYSAFDVFVRDLWTQTTSRLSVTSTGAQANGGSSHLCDVSSDGRFVTFASEDQTLAGGSQFGGELAYIRDRLANTTKMVAANSSGISLGYNNSQRDAHISGDGRFLAFNSYVPSVPNDTNRKCDVFLRDTSFGVTNRVDGGVQGNQNSFIHDISDDGNTVLFLSFATNLVAGDTTPDNFFVVRCVPLAMTPYCFGTASACPCGNAGLSGRGCQNSSSTGGGRLLAVGTASLSADTLLLYGRDMPVTAPALYVQGTSQAASVPFGDGLLCVNGGLARIGAAVSVNGQSQLPQAGGPAISIVGLVTTPGPRRYQMHYRDSAPAFCSSELFNLTNGLEIVWGP